MKKIISILIVLLISFSMANGQVRCLTPLFEQSKLDLYNAFGGSKGPSVGSKDITLHEVGDTATFWNWDLTVMPPEWVQIAATCRAVTEYSYIFVANNQWNVNMDSTDVAMAAYYWEEGTYNDSTAGIYELDTENFGLPPDEIDNDDHIYIFYSALGSYQGSVFDGYFSVYNEYTEEEAQQMGGHSNEVEMFYMSCHPGNPVSPLRISVLAHEFQHMIHWAADPNEETWVDEGCAEYAMLLFGVPDPLVDFPSNPDDDLIVWDSHFSDYIQTFMFFTYLADHYGGAEMIYNVVQDPQNSYFGVQSALYNMGHDITFEQLFVDWAAANFYHGRGGADSPEPDSQYIYYSIDPPAFSTTDWHTNYPAGPNNRGVNHWAADYIVFGNPNEIEGRLVISFEGNTGLNYGLGSIENYNSGIMQADNYYPINNNWTGSVYNFNDFNYFALMVCGPASYGNFDYTYEAEITTGINDAPIPDDGFTLGPLYPNPFNQNTLIEFSLPQGREASIDIYDIGGRMVRQWHIAGDNKTGQLIWDGKNAMGKDVVSGMYFIRLTDGEESRVVRGVLLK